MRGPTLTVMTYPLPRAVLLTVLAGVSGVYVAFFRFPSFPNSLATIAWKLATVAVMVVAVRRFEGRPVTRADAGITPVKPVFSAARTKVAVPALAVLMTLSFAWTSIPGLKSLSASTSGSSYEAGSVGLGILLFELIVRYPITVVVEETFFRGFLQSRLTLAPPVTAGVLFALYHLNQWQTIPSLIPYGIALGVLRWWCGSIWVGAGMHYLGDALFLLSLA
jgi:membrane protease YdiL (CAAX protease family)